MRRKRRKTILLILVAVLILGAASYVMLSPTFLIEEITIAGNNRISDEEVSRMLPFNVGDHILFLRKKIAKELLINDERVAVCEIHRRYPNRVDVVIEEMTPVLLLSAGKIWGLSEKGTLLPIETPYEIPNLPFLSLLDQEISPVAFKRLDSKAVETGLNFWKEAQQSSPQFMDRISEIIVNKDSEIKLVISGAGTVAEIGSGDFKRRFVRLKSVLEEINKNGNNADYIDLRYNDQAIVRLDKNAKQKQSG